MKKRLDQYTMAQFIDIACGDYSSIGADHKAARPVAESLIMQYNRMSDVTSSMANLLGRTKVERCKDRIILYRILLNLVNVYKAYDDVRDILKTTGDTDAAELADEKLSERLEQMLRSEEFLQKRLMQERVAEVPKEVSEDEIRASFDRQTARLMAHFKFAINHERISASVYASLVDIACRQQRQQQASK